MRTWAEIDQRLYQGQATVATVSEALQLIQEQGLEDAAERIDVVVTATFGPVSWAQLFFRPAPASAAQWAEYSWLAGLPLQQGFFPQEFVLETSTRNSRSQQRGGGHLLEAWLAGERLPLRLQLRPTTPSAPSHWEGSIGLADLEAAQLQVVLPSAARGVVAVNSQAQSLPSEFGILLPDMGNAAHTWMGPWEPAVLDPTGKAVFSGLPLLVAGNIGQVAWRKEHCIALSTDFRSTRREQLRALSIPGYKAGLSIGVAWPIAVLGPQTLAPLAEPEVSLLADVLDLSSAQRPFPLLGQVSYPDLSRGVVQVDGRPVPVTSLSSPTRAEHLAEDLKQRLLRREFPPLSPPTHSWGEEGPVP